MKMKKCLCLMLCLVMILVAGTALAENEIQKIFALGEELLLKTENVTLDGSAVFTLDGACFKKADGQIILDGQDSLREIYFRSPRADGTEFENGYVIHVYDGVRYSVESYRPGIYTERIIEPRSTMVRDTVRLEQTLGLGRSAAWIADLLYGNRIVMTERETGGTDYELALTKEELPDMMNGIFSGVLTDLIEHFRGVNYDYMEIIGDADIGDYTTSVEGIVYTLRSMTMNGMEMKVSLDGEGHLSGFSGKADVTLVTRTGKTHQLIAEWTLTAGEYGTSQVGAFDPEPYGAVNEWDLLQTQYDPGIDVVYAPAAYEELNLSEVPVFVSEMTHREIPDEATAREVAADVMGLDILGMTGSNAADWKVEAVEAGWEVTAMGTEGELLFRMVLEKDGGVAEMEHPGLGLENAEIVFYPEFEEQVYTDWRTQVALQLESFSERLNPGETAYWRERNPQGNEKGCHYAAYADALKAGDVEFMIWYGEPNEERTHRSKFIMQTAPEIRLVYFNRYNDVLEGGNG